ncbi:hypothetical protein ACFX1X_015596 [Malus domestica]
MSSFLAKLVLAVVTVYLLLGVFPATSSSVVLLHGAEKSSLSSDDCRGGWRKIIWRKEGSFGCLSKIVSKKTVPIRRSLRKIVTSSRPSPLKNPHKSQGGYAPPPLIA